MKSVGITGGIGAGKSATSDFLCRLGLPVLDTDQVARDVVAPGTTGLDAVVRSFGSGFLDADGGLNRAAMAARVFSDPSARLELERILHPRIQERWQAWLDQRRSGGSPVAFVVIPLLFEKDYAAHFDHVVSIGCSATAQRIRLGNRGWSGDQIKARLEAQMPMEEKMKRSDAVIWNEGDLLCLDDQWKLLLDRWGCLPG